MTRPEPQTPRLFGRFDNKRKLPLDEQNQISRSEYDIEMDRHEAFLRKLNAENGIGVKKGEL